VAVSEAIAHARQGPTAEDYTRIFGSDDDASDEPEVLESDLERMHALDEWRLAEMEAEHRAIIHKELPKDAPTAQILRWTAALVKKIEEPEGAPA
jgi:hypothetical protein